MEAVVTAVDELELTKMSEINAMSSIYGDSGVARISFRIGIRQFAVAAESHGGAILKLA